MPTEIGRGTTPEIQFFEYGVDLRNKTVYATVRQQGVEITKPSKYLNISYEDGKSTVIMQLTQRETLRLKSGTAEKQLRYISSDGTAKITPVESITISRILHEGEIQFVSALESLTVTPPVKLDYQTGESMDWAGVTVIANYTSGNTQDVTSLCDYTPSQGTAMTTAMIMKGAQIKYTEDGKTIYYVIPLEQSM